MESQYSSRKLVPVGIILSLVGVVAVVGIDGIKKILKVGDSLNEGDKVVTGVDGEALLGFADGSSVEIGSSSEAVLNSELYDFSKFYEDADLSVILKAMHEEVLAGEDPSEILAAATKR